ncbi:MAG TPA: mandelate racemase/muconate lactonizing enzyme family protein [Actinobacteria bacterium]|nr:mandelate racemase [bacterium BMS3Bbin01]HDH26126.1 mandelate racemase/muconate lactonizing enzyme family protein [Actinomycetota bacterium]
MRIQAATAFLVDIPVETKRTDAIQAFLKQETIFVELRCDDGSVGLGYSYTIGTGGRAVLAMLETDLLPEIIGEDARRIEAIWQKLFWWIHATTVGAISSLALAAIDFALWDIKAKAANEPLWVLAGGAQDRIPLYDTEGGWLHYDIGRLVEGASRARENGWRGIKLKIGKPSLSEDAERLRAVREAIGDRMALMVDANQSFTYPEARRRLPMLTEYDVAWFEEPLPADDVAGHRLLSDQSTVPIAVGESLYSVGSFREYLAQGAAGIIQVDAARVGGITPWLKVAHLAEAFNIAVAPHFLMEIHVGLACAVPNGVFVEYIPQLRSVMTEEIAIEDGYAVPSQMVGLGIAWDREAFQRMRVK